ncbi:unnamed protein product [Brassica oleracea var. botrytis]|uniref:(rape) hypothetical protein n=1 Tax=Brassica napus TaxID=3708 RepID=A0A816JUT9_BRANA|nr:unnamed protein product [Brassica napus]
MPHLSPPSSYYLTVSVPRISKVCRASEFLRERHSGEVLTSESCSEESSLRGQRIWFQRSLH